MRCLACRRRSCLLRTRLPLYCACTLAALASASAAGAAGAEGAEGAEGAAGSVIVAVEVCICWCCCQWVMNDAKGVDIRRFSRTSRAPPQPLNSPLRRRQGIFVFLYGISAGFLFVAGARVREYDL